MVDEPDHDAEPDRESEPDEGPELARIYREAFASIGRAISLAQDWDAKRVAFANALRDALQYWHGINRQDIIDECFAIAEAKGLTEHFGIDEIQISIAGEVEHAEAREQAPNGNGKYYYGPNEDDEAPAADQAKAPEPEPPAKPFPFVPASSFDGQMVPQRRWLVHDRIPMRNVTLLSGDGAVGKTTIALQLAVALVTKDLDWLQNVIDERGPVLFLTAEEELSEVHFRLAQIVEFYPDIEWSGLTRLHLLSTADSDCVLAVPHRTTILAKTAHYERLALSIDSIKPKLVIMESAADLFAGNEIDRSQVRKFISLLRELAIKHDCAIMLLSHPSVSGMASGSGMSGSTQWNNAVRSRMYFKTVKSGNGEADAFDDDAEAVKDSGSDFRELQYLKNNRARQGDKIKLVYTEGLFLPERQPAPADKAAQDSKADDMFMMLLRKFAGDGTGRTVGVKSGTTYAPAVFCREREAKIAKITNAMLGKAMDRLIVAKKIKSIEYGPPSKLRNKLVELGADDNVLPFK